MPITADKGSIQKFPQIYPREDGHVLAHALHDHDRGRVCRVTLIHSRRGSTILSKLKKQSHSNATKGTIFNSL